MKYLLLTLALLPLSLLGQTISLTWDESPGAEGYRLYGSTNSVSIKNALVKVDTGTNRVVTISTPQAGTWHFAASAYTFGGAIESALSEPFVAVVPEPPSRMAVLAVQWQGTLAGTNWQDMGFFRLRIGTE